MPPAVCVISTKYYAVSDTSARYVLYNLNECAFLRQSSISIQHISLLVTHKSASISVSEAFHFQHRLPVLLFRGYIANTHKKSATAGATVYKNVCIFNVMFLSNNIYRRDMQLAAFATQEVQTDAQHHCILTYSLSEQRSYILLTRLLNKWISDKKRIT